MPSHKPHLDKSLEVLSKTRVATVISSGTDQRLGPHRAVSSGKNAIKHPALALSSEEPVGEESGRTRHDHRES
jgi:hypothetical protein